MKKKTAVLVISYLSAAVLLLGAVAAIQTVRAQEAGRAVRYAGELAFEELCAAVSGMDLSLEKSMYATSPVLAASLCAETQARALAAAAALGQLPMDSQELEQTAAFLAKAEDYAACLLRSSAAGETLTEEEREHLGALSDTAALLCANLSQLRSDVEQGLVVRVPDDRDTDAQTLSKSILQMEGEFPTLPEACYDGALSSGAKTEPAMLENAAEVSEAEALLVAAGFLGLRANLVSSAGRSEGDVPVWRVTAGDYTVLVSVSGGHVVRVMSARAPSGAQLPQEDALERAAAFLSAHGYRSMAETGHQMAGSVLTADYCRRENGVLCRADAVRVAVFLDTGELAGFDALDYLRYHRPRDIPEAAVTAQAAAAALPAALTGLSSRLALVPTDGGGELLCHEILCQGEEDRRCLVYVNAATGQQERILLLRGAENSAKAV